MPKNITEGNHQQCDHLLPSNIKFNPIPKPICFYDEI